MASCGGRCYAMILVENFTRMKWIRFLTRKDGSTAALRGFIADIEADLVIRIIRTDYGEEV